MRPAVRGHEDIEIPPGAKLHVDSGGVARAARCPPFGDRAFCSAGVDLGTASRRASRRTRTPGSSRSSSRSAAYTLSSENVELQVERFDRHAILQRKPIEQPARPARIGRDLRLQRVESTRTRARRAAAARSRGEPRCRRDRDRNRRCAFRSSSAPTCRRSAGRRCWSPRRARRRRSSSVVA